MAWAFVFLPEPLGHSSTEGRSTGLLMSSHIIKVKDDHESDKIEF